MVAWSPLISTAVGSKLTPPKPSPDGGIGGIARLQGSGIFQVGSLFTELHCGIEDHRPRIHGPLII